MTTKEKMTPHTAFNGLLNWSKQGCTATCREVEKFLAPLTDAELVEVHNLFGGHHNNWSDHGAEIGCTAVTADDFDSDDDERLAVEEMHDALKGRWLISHVLYVRGQKAAKAKAKRAA